MILEAVEKREIIKAKNRVFDLFLEVPRVALFYDSISFVFTVLAPFKMYLTLYLSICNKCFVPFGTLEISHEIESYKSHPQSVFQQVLSPDLICKLLYAPCYSCVSLKLTWHSAPPEWIFIQKQAGHFAENLLQR